MPLASGVLQSAAGAVQHEGQRQVQALAHEVVQRAVLLIHGEGALENEDRDKGSGRRAAACPGTVLYFSYTVKVPFKIRIEIRVQDEGLWHVQTERSQSQVKHATKSQSC